MSKSKPNKKSWIVKVRRVTITEIVNDNCTEEEVRQNPWFNRVEERDLGNTDWDVISVEENI